MIDKKFIQNIYKYSLYLSLFVFLLFFKYFSLSISFISGILFFLLVLKSIEIIVSKTLKKDIKDIKTRKKYFAKLFFLKYIIICVFFYFLVKVEYISPMFFCFGTFIPSLIIFISAVIVIFKKGHIKYA